MAQKTSVTPGFWHGKRVLLTGHTGFKGAWMALLLQQLGAKVTGISLAPDTTPSLWNLFEPKMECESHIADIRDAEGMRALISKIKPEICIHMAAQALVRRGYEQPQETFATNVTGTVNILEALRHQQNIRAILVVTSDKVYRNDNTGHAFTEMSPLGGSDPYSASKAACEIVTRAYAESFFASQGIAIATARGGNVIGGGDWSADRLVPDIYRALAAGATLELRYPEATRPWQHVLDCISGYLQFTEYLWNHKNNTVPALNFGPQEKMYPNVAQVAESIASHMGQKIQWKHSAQTSMTEKSTLMLDSREAARVLGWQPQLSTPEAIRWTGEWYGTFSRGEDTYALANAQLGRYIALGAAHG